MTCACGAEDRWGYPRTGPSPQKRFSQSRLDWHSTCCGKAPQSKLVLPADQPLLRIQAGPHESRSNLITNHRSRRAIPSAPHRHPVLTPQTRQRDIRFSTIPAIRYPFTPPEGSITDVEFHLSSPLDLHRADPDAGARRVCADRRRQWPGRSRHRRHRCVDRRRDRHGSPARHRRSSASTTTNASGDWEARFLQPGAYSIAFEQAGSSRCAAKA